MLLAVLAVAIALAMGHALGHPFLRGNDELETVLENPVVQGPLASAFGGAFRTITVGAWAPLHLLSHALDRAVFGTWAGGSVLVNLLLHLLNATLVAALARRIGAPTLAVWAAGLLFAVHPVQVESVVSITQRKTVLSTAFLLLALHAWVSHARAQETAGRRRFYGLALLAGIAALMTKPVAVVLPLQLALVDLPLGRARASWRSLLEKLPFIVAAAALAVVTALGKVEVSITTAVTGHSRSVGFAGLAWYGGGPVDTFLTMLTVVPRYLRLLFWPVNLSIIYTPPVRTGLDAEVAGSLLLVLALGALLMVAARKRPRLACWAGLFVAGLLPVSQILPQATLMNDRYLYVPLLGGAPLVGEGLALLATRITGGRRALVVELAGHECPVESDVGSVAARAADPVVDCGGPGWLAGERERVAEQGGRFAAGGVKACRVLEDRPGTIDVSLDQTEEAEVVLGVVLSGEEASGALGERKRPGEFTPAHQERARVAGGEGIERVELRRPDERFRCSLLVPRALPEVPQVVPGQPRVRRLSGRIGPEGEIARPERHSLPGEED